MHAWYLLLLAQIVLESLPISSSGHCLLLAVYYHVQPMCDDTHLMYFAHIPTALIIVCYFFKQWFFPCANIVRCWHIVCKIIGYTLLADVMTILGYGIKKMGAMPEISLSTGLFITACLLYSLRWCNVKPSVWNARNAVILGIAQGIAFVPGISRFAITFVVARWLGIAVRRAFQISFLLHWPLIVASCLYSYCVLDSCAYELLNLPLLTGMIVAGIMAYSMLCGVAWMMYCNYMWIWSLYLIIMAYISFLWEL